MTPSTLHDAYVARRRIGGAIFRTGLAECPWLGDRTGLGVWLKLESLQRTGSFKIRGALNAVRALSELPGGAGRVVTASAGNHGQALACAAAASNIEAVVFTPADAPKTKLDAIRRYGATLHPVGKTYDDAEQQATAYARDQQLPFISPYNHPDVIAGQATLGLEVLEDLPSTGTVVVPVGGGGLISGVASAVKAISPTVRVVGVEAARNPAFTTALARGCITPIEAHPTIADGLSGNLEPGSITFEIVQRLVDEVVTVDEDAIVAAIGALVERSHLVVEGAGAVGVAAVASGRLDDWPEPLVALVTGSNIDLHTLMAAAGAPRPEAWRP